MGEAVDEFENFRERCPTLEKEFGNTGDGKEMLQSPAGPEILFDRGDSRIAAAGGFRDVGLPFRRLLFFANESMFFTVLQFAGRPVARKEGARGASRRTSAFTFAGVRNSRQ